jgi:hypothetical protein
MNTEVIKKPEATLWQTADTLCASSDLKSSEYSTPLPGMIFLKFAGNKYSLVENEITAEYGTVFDPVCGSGGMFLQSAQFIEYKRELSDRLEITSSGALPPGLSRNEFFSGMSMPRNKELMRVFKDMKMVEYLGSGVPRILKAYDENVFKFSDNFIRIVFMYEEGYEIGVINFSEPESQPEWQPESLGQKVILILSDGEFSKNEISNKLGQKEISGRLNQIMRELLEKSLIEYTVPEKPNSRLQKYRLTELGKNETK